MPLVERPAVLSSAAAFPSTASSGPLFLHATMHAASSSSPDSPATSSTGKPPISPPHVVPRLHPTTTTTTLPALVRLPSLTTRTNQALHIASPVGIPSHHRPSVIPPPTPQNALPPSPPGSPSPSPRELAARLALLLHARECCTPLDVERTCGVRNCRVARGVLDHCQECFLPEGECHRSCSEAKQLLRHFRVCRAQHFERACAVCDLLHAEFAWALKHARSLTPLFVPRTSAHGPTGPSYEPQRRHSSYQPEPVVMAPATAATSLRRSVSEGPHATMSATGHHKRTTATGVDAPTVKRVRIVTPTEEAAARAAAQRRA